jgi:hypothetical protein
MTEQRTPDALSTQAENELICEKLLGFKKHCDRPECRDWYLPGGGRYWNNPSFTTWADAGLILEAFERRHADYDIERTETDTGYASTFRVFTDRTSQKTLRAGAVPLAIRAAAIKYVRSLP